MSFLECTDVSGTKPIFRASVFVAPGPDGDEKYTLVAHVVTPEFTGPLHLVQEAQHYEHINVGDPAPTDTTVAPPEDARPVMGALLAGKRPQADVGFDFVASTGAWPEVTDNPLKPVAHYPIREPGTGPFTYQVGFEPLDDGYEWATLDPQNLNAHKYLRFTRLYFYQSRETRVGSRLDGRLALYPWSLNGYFQRLRANESTAAAVVGAAMAPPVFPEPIELYNCAFKTGEPIALAERAPNTSALQRHQMSGVELLEEMVPQILVPVGSAYVHTMLGIRQALQMMDPRDAGRFMLDVKQCSPQADADSDLFAVSNALESMFYTAEDQGWLDLPFRRALNKDMPVRTIVQQLRTAEAALQTCMPQAKNRPKAPHVYVWSTGPGLNGAPQVAKFPVPIAGQGGQKKTVSVTPAIFARTAIDANSCSLPRDFGAEPGTSAIWGALHKAKQLLLANVLRTRAPNGTRQTKAGARPVTIIRFPADADGQIAVANVEFDDENYALVAGNARFKATVYGPSVDRGVRRLMRDSDGRYAFFTEPMHLVAPMPQLVFLATMEDRAYVVFPRLSPEPRISATVSALPQTE